MTCPFCGGRMTDAGAVYHLRRLLGDRKIRRPLPSETHACEECRLYSTKPEPVR